MKKFSIYMSACLLTLMVGCHEEFLEENPISDLSLENFYTTEEEAVAGVTAAYETLGKNDFYVPYLIMTEFPTDIAIHPNRDPINDFSWDASNGDVRDFWRETYEGIGRANVIISRIPDGGLRPEVRNRVEAEARFIRGFYYFTLIRFYGNVPLVDFEINTLDALNEVYNNSNVDTHEEVWNLILDDLRFAEQYLPINAPQGGRVTRASAKGMLVKVFLQRAGLATYSPYASFWGLEGINATAEWDSTYTRAREMVENAGALGTGLIQDYKALFEKEAKNGPEHLFSIQFENIGFERMGSFMSNITIPAYMRGRNRYAGEVALYDLWVQEGDTANDVRFDVSLITQFQRDDDTIRLGDSQLKFPLVGKYLVNTTPESNISDEADHNVNVLRYADVLLAYSEAANALDQPDRFEGINAVRARAGLAPLEGLDQEGLRQAIIRERIFELCFEGHGHFDYNRHGVLTERNERLGYTVEPFQHIYPIPISDIQLNPAVLRQNQGY